MSKISEVYDEIISLAETVFPNHVELVNPYEITVNDDLTFKQAYGLAFSSGANTNKEMSKNLTIQREFIFTLTRKIFASGTSRATGAMTERRNQEKQIFEDQLAIIRKFEQHTYIQNQVNIAKLLYESDSGIEFIKVGQYDLIMLRSIFILEYWQGVE